MNVAFIPVRGGSKSIPLKNIKIINGKPLVYWTLKAACGSEFIDKVYVSTDSDIIREAVEGFKDKYVMDSFEKVQVIGRSAESASDVASTESAMLEFAEKYEFDNIVLVQATSPLLESSDLDRGFKVFSGQDTDSVLSVVRQKRFHWSIDKNGYSYPTNYDVYNRPRRQEFDGYLVENGAFYITSRNDLLRSQNRVSGNIKTVEMNEDSFYEIDEPSDWIVIESLMRKHNIKNNTGIPIIKMFLTDCDGCLTDGGMYYSEHGDELKKFNTRDGMGFSILKGNGIITGIVTSENVELNRRRVEKLQLDILEAGCKDKLATVTKLCEMYGILMENVCYVGDDINDLEVIKEVGLGCCPQDAMPQIKEVAKYVAQTKGGEGVIREIVEMIVRKENN